MPVQIKITDITCLVVNAGRRNWVLVKVTTDQDGLYGWGEGTLEWKTRSVVAAVEDLKPVLIGHDPRDVDQMVRRMLKFSFWPQGPIGMTAVSAIEHALWDIFGKSVGLPVWRLLGGKARDSVNVYTHLGLGKAESVYGVRDKHQLAELGQAVIESGYNAMKVLLLPLSHYTASAKDIDEVGASMQCLREAVGPDTEIMVDFHGRPASVALAVQYIHALDPFRPLFVEEPIQPGDARAMRDVSIQVKTPIATGERLIRIKEFESLFTERAVSIVQPDLCHCGGLSMARRIAAMAEVALIGVAPHNPAGPVATAVALHFAVSTPNFVIQEEMTGAVPWFNDVVDSPIKRVNGAWQLPECIGLGVEVNESEARKHPYIPEDWKAAESILADGTIVDR